MSSSGVPCVLRYVSPNWLTSTGRLGSACATRFWRVDLVDVAVGADVEGDAQGDRAVVRVDRLHVEHVVDAVHLLLDRRRDRLLDR